MVMQRGRKDDKEATKPKLDIFPKIKQLRTKGAIVFPKELIAPAKMSLLVPCNSPPSLIINGLATICCKANPIAIIKRELRRNKQEFTLVAITKEKVPNADKTNPVIMTFPEPNFANQLGLFIETNKQSNDPQK